MIRNEDESGVSGIGAVVEGVEFGDGTVAIRWLSDYCSTAIYDDMETFMNIHIHSHPSNRTEIHWSDGRIWQQQDTLFES